MDDQDERGKEEDTGIKGWLRGTHGAHRTATVEHRAEEQYRKIAANLELNPRRIAVLPFSSLSPNSQDEYFADGMTEEVISTISKIQGLEIISRTSIVQYKKSTKPIKEISKDLEAGTILEGSVRKVGNKLRISTQMIDAARDRHLWSESYDRELQDIFAIQSDIASKVAEALQARIPKRGIEAETTENLEAYALYLKAVQLSHKSTESSLKEAIFLFEKATSLDKIFARAYAGLANTWGRMASCGYEDFEIATRKAEIAARKAVRIAPDLAEGHASLAEACSYLDKYKESISEAERAIQINPNLSEAHISLGILRADDSLEYTLAELKKAHELDPLSYKAGEYLASVYIARGKTSEALGVLEKLRDIDPRYAGIYVKLADCYMERAEFSKAQEMLDICFKINPDDNPAKIDQGLLYVYAGKKDKAEAILQNLMENEEESVRLWAQLWIQNALRNFDECFKTLKRMGETHDWPFLIKYLSDFKELRKDPRFLEFCVSVGITPPGGDSRSPESSPDKYSK